MKVSKIVIRSAAALVFLALCAAPALAQRGKWWQDERFRRELSLTDEQSTRLEAIFQKHLPTLRERMRTLNQAEEQLDRLIENGDEASVIGYVGTVESARAELNKTRTMMLLRMRRALTADQWAKFTALADERGGRGRGRPDRGLR
ncbi:MAG: periplasmic heavy metal sensor [Acidobacteria bacterium]|nr:periplasmic heavy metal sensor [Acidobacteriota bacterium]